MTRVIASYPEFKNAISPTWYCTSCNTSVGFDDERLINLNQEIKNTKLDELIGMKCNSLLKDHRAEQSLDGDGTMKENHDLIFGNDQKTSILWVRYASKPSRNFGGGREIMEMCGRNKWN